MLSCQNRRFAVSLSVHVNNECIFVIGGDVRKIYEIDADGMHVGIKYE